ncbi:MAG TPA: ROK family protein [Actinomycetes bacterium]|nr:ROK family protein [Actinomycetes bacterium]
MIGAVDIGATKTLVGLAGDDGRLLHGPRVRLATPPTPDLVVGAVTRALVELAADAGGYVRAVGCAVPGPLDRDRGVVRRIVNLGLADVALGPELAAILGVPVAIEDDANAAGLGEAVVGAGRGVDVLAYLTVSTGVGAAVIIDGRILHGAHDAAGEIGHLVLDPTGPECSCGRRGDIESYAGGASMLRRAAQVWPDEPAAAAARPLSVPDLFAWAQRGDADATRLVDQAVDALAAAVAALVSTVDPGRVVIGGSVALGQPGLVPTVATMARQRVIDELAADLRVVPADLGAASGLAGAALLGWSLLADPGTPPATDAPPLV